MSERFLQGDRPSADQLAGAQEEVATQLESAIAAHPRFLDARRLVGLAGTVSTLASLHLGMVEYDRDRIHHSVLGVADVEGWFHRLASDSAAERLARPGMVPGREDVIVGGAMILDSVMKRFGFSECLVSESDILDGMVASLLGGE